MGQKWDRLGGDTFQDPSVVGGFQDGAGGNPYSRSRVRYGGTQPGKSEKKDWQAGGGFSRPGIGERQTEWPSYSATSRYGTANPTCAECGGRLRGARKCSCEQPHDHWKAIGKRRDPENEGLPDTMTGGGMARHMSAIAEWHEGWLAEVYRVLEPGGVVKAFGGSRVFHRLASAMESAGFEGVGVEMEAWNYASGFPKSHDVSKKLDKMAGVERDIIGYKRGVGGENLNDIVRGVGVVRTHNDPGGKGLGACGVGAKQVPIDVPITAPASLDASRWQGWGTALKPAWEPVVVGRKPVGCSLTPTLETP